MSAHPVAIFKTGLVTAVGQSAPASCAAFRAKINSPTETRFIDSSGGWIMAHQVELERPCQGVTKLVKMAAMAMREVLVDVPEKEWGRIPVLLCCAESQRPGRPEVAEERLLSDIARELNTRFAPQSAVIAQGRVAVATALARARELVYQQRMSRVLVVATDSLINWHTLSHYDRESRLLTELNSNGFMPGEGAGALWVGADEGHAAQLICTGIGFGKEAAHIDSGEPLRAEGMTQAIKSTLADAGRQLHELHFRITDNSGEQYYFKEASLALSRTLRQRMEEFEIWHPAECTGEAGALAGVAVIAMAQHACLKGYAPGPNVLTHWANDAGDRAAVTLEYRVAA